MRQSGLDSFTEIIPSTGNGIGRDGFPWFNTVMMLFLSLITGFKSMCARAALTLIMCSGALAQTEKSAVLVAERLPTRIAAAGSESLFSPLSAEATGIVFQNDIDISHPLKRLYQSGFACGWIAIGDLDGDAMP